MKMKSLDKNMSVLSSGSQPGVRKLPWIHGKISRGTWMAVEFSRIAIF